MNKLYEGIDKIVAEKDAEIAELRVGNARMREALDQAGKELGVPQPGYPAPVANAAKIIADALSTPAPAGAVVTLEQLREIEWESEGCDMDGGEAVVSSTCPACGGAHPKFAPNRPRLLGHAPDCWLAAAIRDAEDKPC
jgi:hypothetical protein